MIQKMHKLKRNYLLINYLNIRIHFAQIQLKLKNKINKVY